MKVRGSSDGDPVTGIRWLVGKAPHLVLTRGAFITWSRENLAAANRVLSGCQIPASRWELITTKGILMIPLAALSRQAGKRSRILTPIAISLFWLSWAAMQAQTTVATGSIQGSVTDPSGAVVVGAKVTITHKATGQVITVATTSSGAYASGALTPGDYSVHVEGQGFKTLDATIPVQVGVTASGNFKLQLGDASQIVEVQGSELQVNTEQASVQGVINTEQIENLPINGRNFLDLAQLEPGIQIQHGGNYDPTKKGFSTITYPGPFGRTARRGIL